jgi:hypothetical protein
VDRFSEEEYTAILKTFYTHDCRLSALGSHLLKNALLKSEQTLSTKPIEKWARAWKKCRLNIKKSYHKYNLSRSSDKRDIELLFNLYLNDKSVAKLLRETPQNVLDMMTQIMGTRSVKLIVKHPNKGFAERIASRLANGFEKNTKKQFWIRARD